MTPDEIRIAEALAGCSFCPGSSQKRFVRHMAGRTTNPRPITDKQRAYLWAVAWSWRRQLSKELADLAHQYSGGIGVQGRHVNAERLQEHIRQAMATTHTQAPAGAALATPSYHARRRTLHPLDQRQEALDLGA